MAQKHFPKHYHIIKKTILFEGEYFKVYYGMYTNFMNQQCCPDNQHSSCDYRMTVTGKGRVTAVPDKATVILGVVTEGSELKTIQQENAARMSEVLNTLKRMGIGEKDIGTQTYDISMIYDYVDNKRVFKGYRVTNTIKVNLKDIQKAGEVIDAAVSSGANLVENIDFTLSDQSIYYHKALNLAARDAALNAKALESTLGIVVDEVPVSITEEANSYVPMAVKAVSTFESATPIKPGLMDITAAVKAVFTYRKI